MRLHFQKKVLVLFFSLLFSIALFHPSSASAAICTYQTRNPTTGVTVPNIQNGVDVPFCEEMATDNCSSRCAGDNNRIIINCNYQSSQNSCQAFYNQSSEAEKKAEAERQKIEAGRDALDKIVIEERSGKCMCSITDPDAPLTPFDGATPDSCYDRNENTGNGQGDNANVNLYNCRWVLNEDVIPTGDQNTTDLINKYNEENPLKQYQGQVAGLNKLRATSVQGFIALVIKTATGIMGSIALVMMIYGGFLWMTSSGNSSQVDKAQNVIFYGALGIFVIFGSYALITFIFQAVNPNLIQ